MDWRDGGGIRKEGRKDGRKKKSNVLLQKKNTSNLIPYSLTG